MFIKVKTFPDAPRDHVEEKNPDTFRVFVREKASGGMANKRMMILLAEHLKIPASRLHIIKGHTAPNKILEIREK